MESAQQGWMIGIDIGGTFTDVACSNAVSGELRVAKVPLLLMTRRRQ